MEQIDKSPVFLQFFLQFKSQMRWAWIGVSALVLGLTACGPSFEERFDCEEIEGAEIDDVTIRYAHDKIRLIHIANGEFEIDPDTEQGHVWFNLYNCGDKPHRLQVRTSFYDEDHRIIDTTGWTEIYIGVRQVRSGEFTSDIQNLQADDLEIEGALLELKPLR